MTALRKLLSAFAEDHGRKTVDECEVLLLRQDSALPKQAEKIPRVSTRGASFSFFIIVVAIFLFLPRVVFAQNLLQNPGFEELLFNWETSSGLDIAFNFTISSYVKKSGDCSALIKHDKTGSYGAQQIIRNIVEGDQYLGKGYVLFNNENAKSAKIRIAWYSSDDGSGSQIKTVDSNVIDTTFPSWQELDTGIIEAPTTAKSAEFRILLASSENTESFVYFDDLVFEKVNQPVTTPTSTQNPIPSPSPTTTPTSISEPPTLTPKLIATYKVNEVKDNDGEVLSSVKVYVDGVYIHHYAPEVLTFCDGCQCDGYVGCGFGQHTIKLEKTGYEDWGKEITINPNTSDEVSPVMVFLESSPISTPTPTQKILTPTQKISPTPTPKKSNQTATASGEVLGEEVSTISAFYPYEATDEAEKNEATPSARNKIIPKIFLIGGLLLLFVSACWLWYTFKYTS